MTENTQKFCVEEGCTNKPYYNFPGEAFAKWCCEHKPIITVNVKNRVCLEMGCNKQPSFNYPDRSHGVRCITHKLEGMVNVKKRKCEFEGCSKSALYNIKGEKKGIWCKEHKPKDKNYVNIFNTNKCEINGCEITPSFNFIYSTRPARCLNHKIDGMINIKNKLCAEEGCLKRASYAYPNNSSRWCCLHKKKDMINVFTKKPQKTIHEKLITSPKKTIVKDSSKKYLYRPMLKMRI
jgi:hypothetical protein